MGTKSLTDKNTKVLISWDAAWCIPIKEVYASFIRVEDGGNRFFGNFGKYLPEYTALHPRRTV
jgi:hypothetical protein